MTQEEKELLLKDLCARLPYGIKCTTKLTGYNDVYDVQGVYEDNIFIDCPVYEEGDNEWMIESIIPFLRPMSSMTEKELDELLDGENSDFDGKSELVKRAMTAYIKGDKLLSNELFSMQYAKTIDWLNAHYFDYRGLIPMGLGIDCTGLNIY